MAKQRNQENKRRTIARGEALALHADAIRSDGPRAFFFLFGPAIKANERIGSVAVVHVRGPLEQHADCWGENYESLVKRVRDAMTGADVRTAHERAVKEAEWRGEDPPEAPDASPPSSVVLRISSPGGVVAGLNETVRKLRALSIEHDVPLVAYVDEMAASAAYALACACDDIYLPPSGMVGSIGVISHMWSIARANDEDGIDVEVIASGDYKADGNENLPIEAGAIDRERKRVMKLARQFWTLAASARGLSVAQVAGYEAAVFLGSDGVKSGLADDVMAWDDLMAQLSLAQGGTSVPRSTAQGGTSAAEEPTMTRLQALIAQTKKDLAKASGKARADLEAKLSRLTASLADLKAYKKTKYVKEEETSEEDDSDDEESEDECADEDAEDAEDDDEDPPKKDEKKSKRKSEDEDADAEDAEDDAESEDDDPDKDAEDEGADEEAIAALTSHLKGRTAQGVRGHLAAVFAKARAYDQVQPTVAKLQATEKARERDAAIDAAIKGRRITKRHAKDLRTKPLAFVKQFIAMHKAPLYLTEDEADLPNMAGGGEPMGGSRVPAEIASIIDMSVAAQSNDPKRREELRADAVKRWRESQNGVSR